MWGGCYMEYPQHRAREQDEEAVRQWRLVEWPRIKKKPGTKGRPSSQSGFMLQPTRRRTWAFSGHTPIHKVWDRLCRFKPPLPCRLDGSDWGCIRLITLIRKMWCPLLVILGMIRRKVVLILDRWSVHRAAVAVLQKRYPDRLTIEWLPLMHPNNPARSGIIQRLANFIPHIEDLAGRLHDHRPASRRFEAVCNLNCTWDSPKPPSRRRS